MAKFRCKTTQNINVFWGFWGKTVFFMEWTCRETFCFQFLIVLGYHLFRFFLTLTLFFIHVNSFSSECVGSRNVVLSWNIKVVCKTNLNTKSNGQCNFMFVQFYWVSSSGTLDFPVVWHFRLFVWNMALGGCCHI